MSHASRLVPVSPDYINLLAWSSAPWQSGGARIGFIITHLWPPTSSSCTSTALRSRDNLLSGCTTIRVSPAWHRQLGFASSCFAASSCTRGKCSGGPPSALSFCGFVVRVLFVVIQMFASLGLLAAQSSHAKYCQLQSRPLVKLHMALTPSAVE